MFMSICSYHVLEMPQSLHACTFPLQKKLSRCCFCNQRIKDRVSHAGDPYDLIVCVCDGHFMLYVHVSLVLQERVIMSGICRKGRWQDYVCLHSVEGVVAVCLGLGMEHNYGQQV